VAAAHRGIQAGRSLEGVVADLKNEGFSRVDSIRAVVEITGASLGDAKLIVGQSQAWEAVRQETEDFHVALEAELRSESKPEK
jgi:hypothetical protein